MNFEVVGEVVDIEVIATGASIREINRLRKFYGDGRWRKLKGVANVRWGDRVLKAEIHWYEAHGIGKKEIKIKRILEG